MPSNHQAVDYEPVTHPRRARAAEDEHAEAASWAAAGALSAADTATEEGWTTPRRSSGSGGNQPPTVPPAEQRSTQKSSAKKEAPPEVWIHRRGHGLTYAALFLFTAVLLFRPYEFLPLPTTLAFWLGIATLAIFPVVQFATEGTLTARPREVNLVLLLCVMGLLSIPLAKASVAEAWATFSDVFIRAVLMFIVIVNAVRTEKRLKGMLLLSIAVGCMLSVGALNNYRLGIFAVEGYRVAGMGQGMFGNPNDMALHLVTMIPVAVGLLFSTRGPLRKVIYAAAAVLMVAGTVVTFSRAGFLALLVVLGALGWKIGRKHRLAVAVVALVSIITFLALAPGNYSNRVLSIFDHERDAVGSADSRQALLFRSIKVALRNPLGIGMGNFPHVSIRSQVAHNTYTEVAAEMGMAALAIYLMFIITPLKRLREIERGTFATRRGSRFYYLAVGLQASLLGFMVASFFASVAYYWNIYYLVGYAVCLRRVYDLKLHETSGAALPAAPQKTWEGAEEGQRLLTDRGAPESATASAALLDGREVRA